MSPTKPVIFPICLHDVQYTQVGEFPLRAKIMRPLVILHHQLEAIGMQKGWSPTVVCIKMKIIIEMDPKMKKAPVTPAFGIEPLLV